MHCPQLRMMRLVKIRAKSFATLCASLPADVRCGFQAYMHSNHRRCRPLACTCLSSGGAVPICRHSFFVLLGPNTIFVIECKPARSAFIHPPTPHVLPRLRPGSLTLGDTLDQRHKRTASGAPSMSLGHRACIAEETPRGLQYTSQATHRL